MQAKIFGEYSLTYVPLFLPLFAESPNQIRHILLVISSVANVREMALALNEALSTIEEKAASYSMSDDDDYDGGYREAGGEDDEVLLDQLQLVLDCYTTSEDHRRSTLCLGSSS